MCIRDSPPTGGQNSANMGSVPGGVTVSANTEALGDRSQVQEPSSQDREEENAPAADESMSDSDDSSDSSDDKSDDESMGYINLLQESGIPKEFKNCFKEITELLKITSELEGNDEENVETCIRRCRAVVSEVCSLPRITKAAEVFSQLNIDPGLAMDITTVDGCGNEWGFSKDSMKLKAKKKLREQKPDLLVGLSLIHI